MLSHHNALLCFSKRVFIIMVGAIYPDDDIKGVIKPTASAVVISEYKHFIDAIKLKMLLSASKACALILFNAEN